MSSPLAFVFIKAKDAETGNHAYNLVSPQGLTRSQLCRFSILASKRLEQGDNSAKKKLNLPDTIFDGPAVEKILNAMIGNDTKKPTPLTVNGLKIKSFNELVTVYRNAQHLELIRNSKGSDLRDTIIAGIKKKPLSYARFVQLIEQLDFDSGIASLVKHNVMYGEVKGKKHVCPEFDQIKAYAIKHEEQYGLWSEMVDIQAEIAGKMQASDLERAREKGKAMPGVEGYEEAFPALPGKKE